MCSYFSTKGMENYQGDLNDIIRASTVGGGGAGAGRGSAGAELAAPLPPAEWQFSSNPINYSEDHFGDPFIQFRDPILYDIPRFFPNSNIIKESVDEDASFGGFGGNNNNNSGINLGGQKILDDEMKRPTNIFSRMLQISPGAKFPVLHNDSPAAAVALKNTTAPVPLPANQSLSSPNNTKGCLIESPAGLQISSPRNTGIKRRKGQAKKVVCIPAPAPANSRSSGEVVPSDLWAWRKYGQKPIKGSPYPRGYYRCSSSKGCLARKQVERSRTDPNMLVITYTSEHNHPWPTQRNALAGSTRSQPFKAKKCSNSKEDAKDMIITKEATNSDGTVKEETADQDLDNQLLEMDDAAEFDDGFPTRYKPSMPESDSFFADLEEIQCDQSLDMLFTPGEEKSCLDPFSFYDWAATGNTPVMNNSGGGGTTSYGEGKTMIHDEMIWETN